MKNDEAVVLQVLEVIETLIEGAGYLFQYACEREEDKFNALSRDMQMSLTVMRRSADILKKNQDYLRIDIACQSTRYSLDHIINLWQNGIQLVLDKIEFELIPFLQDMYFLLYFQGYVVNDPERIKKYNEQEIYELCTNQYIQQSEITGEYKYDLSIYVLAYNKLEYTKLCVESILKYVPEGLNYELILLNNGSSDGTEEYFNSLAAQKCVNILNNNAFITISNRIIEGKYFLAVSNDVVITPNAIANMLKCMESDESIAYAVPTTPNVSNLQTIEASYSSMEEMYAFAAANNRSNPFRWEQRVRLCNPASIHRSSAYIGAKGLHDAARFLENSARLDGLCFPDDKASLLNRRRGYKMMLIKDAYCYHFGSVTIKEEKDMRNDAEYYNKGRISFYGTYGIDPWGTGFCWSQNLFPALACEGRDHINILGVNCGLGSNPLKVREILKEQEHNLDVSLYNVTDAPEYKDDLLGVSDFVSVVRAPKEIHDMYQNAKFRYIIFEKGFRNQEDFLITVKRLVKRLEAGGRLAVCTTNEKDMKRIMREYPESRRNIEWAVITPGEDSHA